MSRRKNRNAGNTRRPPADAPAANRAFLLVTTLLLAAWIATLAVLAWVV